MDIGALANDVVKLVGSEAALRKIPISIEVSPSIKPVFGDPILLQQCVLNLLVNAFDAVTEVPPDRRKVAISITPEKQGWIATNVVDTGSGIHPSVAGRLFEPFVTTKNNGMGLGLLVTRSIVEDHGGKIWSKPIMKGGTAFTFTLPEAGKAQRRRIAP